MSAAAAARAGGAVLSAAADNINRAQTSLAASAASKQFVLSKNVLHLLVVHLAALVACLQEKQHSGTAAARAVKSSQKRSSSTTSTTSISTSSSSVSTSNQQGTAPAPHQQLLAAAGLQAKHVTCQRQSSAPQVSAVNSTVVIRAALQHILEQLPVQPAMKGSGQDSRAHGKLIDGYLPPELLQALLLVLAELTSMCQSTGLLRGSTGVLSCVLQTMGICQQLLAASSVFARLVGHQGMDDSTADKVGLHKCCIIWKLIATHVQCSQFAGLMYYMTQLQSTLNYKLPMRCMVTAIAVGLDALEHCGLARSKPHVRQSRALALLLYSIATNQRVACCVSELIQCTCTAAIR
jgi:hypothetical protein